MLFRSHTAILPGDPVECHISNDCGKECDELAKTCRSASVNLSAGNCPCVEFRSIPPRFWRFFSRNKGSCGDTTFIRAQAEMIIPGMGCVACINKINKSLQGFTNLVGSEAWLVDSGGKARVQYVVASEAVVKDVVTGGWI